MVDEYGILAGHSHSPYLRTFTEFAMSAYKKSTLDMPNFTEKVVPRTELYMMNFLSRLKSLEKDLSNRVIGLVKEAESNFFPEKHKVEGLKEELIKIHEKTMRDFISASLTNFFTTL